MTTQLPITSLIESEIADFFAGFVEIHTELGGPNTVEEAQTQLTERICALLAAYEQEPVKSEWFNADSGKWMPFMDGIHKRVIAKSGHKIRDLYTHHAPSIPAVPDEIVGWVRDENGDSRDPLFLCGSVSPYEGKAYNSQYFPIKRSAMLNGGKS